MPSAEVGKLWAERLGLGWGPGSLRLPTPMLEWRCWVAAALMTHNIQLRGANRPCVSAGQWPQKWGAWWCGRGELLSSRGGRWCGAHRRSKGPFFEMLRRQGWGVGWGMLGIPCGQQREGK